MQLNELDNRDVYYFAYGMLTNTDNMEGATPIGRAVLNNYKLDFYHYATITKSPGSSVIGGLYKISNTYLDRLDIIESFPEFYNRIVVPVKFNNRMYNSYVYIMTQTYRQDAIKYNDRYPTKNIISNMQLGYHDFDIPISQIKNALNDLKSQI